MKVYLIAIGDEILLGRTVNTHGAYIGRKLSAKGIEVNQHSTVGDDPSTLEPFLRRAIDEADVVITTGGLGPTGDDNTKDVLARIFGRKIRRDTKILNCLKKRYKRKLSGIVRTQADVPEKTIVIPNHVGSAPGFIFSIEGKTAIALPGPPQELKPMFEEHVVPYMLKLRGRGVSYLARTLRTVGISESEVESKIAKPVKKREGVALGLCARPFQVDIRISTTTKSMREGSKLLDDAEKIIQEKVGEYIYTKDDKDIEVIVGEMLRKSKLTIAVAESCTGGLIGSRLTDVPGSSDYFLGGMISYSNDWKTGLLGIPNRIIDRHGAVSLQAAKAMAENVREKSGASIGLSSTGIAGPAGGTREKPVGLVYVAISDEKETNVYKYQFHGSRELVRLRTSQAALAILWQRLKCYGQ